MKIFGHPWIESPEFITVESKEEIANTQADSILLFEDINNSLESIKYSQKEGLPFALKVSTINHTIFAYNLNANYLLVTPQLAKEIQDIAQHYLFDTQIIVEIQNETEIEKYAQMGIDGVIFQQTIK